MRNSMGPYLNVCIQTPACFIFNFYPPESFSIYYMLSRMFSCASIDCCLSYKVPIYVSLMFDVDLCYLNVVYDKN